MEKPANFLEDLPSFRLNIGDVLIAMSGATTGKMAVFDLEIPALLNQRVGRFKIVAPDLIDSEYVGKLVRNVTEKVLQKAYGGAQPNISPTEIESFEIPLPPLNEQRRIVSTIEQLTDRSHKARAALEDVPKLIAQFRQSVLAAAFRGDLTADWREKNPDIEPASELLERIKIDRRKRWEEAELEKMRAQGKEPKDDKWKNKYQWINVIDEDDLFDIPSEWIWVKLDNLIATGPQNGVYIPRDKYGMGTPILRIDNFQDGWSNSSDELQLVNASESDKNLYSLERGDLVINRVNSLTHLGKSLLVESRNLPALFESNMMRLNLVRSVSSQFVELYLRSPFGRKFLTKDAKWAVNQASINQTDVKSTYVPLPPFDEQLKIAQILEKEFLGIIKISEALDFSKKLLESQDRSILAKAFRGELVPQDPNDEPAAVLLERIRAEREQTSTPKQRGKTTRKNSSTQLSINLE
jgi:type I restriction enzyme, S subunit